MSKLAAASRDSGCVHHWLLSPPQKGHVAAVCKHCGRRRDFEEEPARAHWRRTAGQERHSSS